MNRWRRTLLLTMLLAGLLLIYFAIGKKGRSANGGETSTPPSLSELGVTMEIPEGMTVNRRGKDFVWLSDNGSGIMRNICIYSYPATRLDTAVVVNKRDSVMSRNIQGEEPQMHMKTDRQREITQRCDDDSTLRTSGWWEMEGDMMGGPFVCHSRYDARKRRVIVAEAFLYAPDRDKEVPLQRLEEVLTTLKTE